MPIIGETGWGGRIRTCEWRHQKALPYHLATPQQACCKQANLRLLAASIGDEILRRNNLMPSIGGFC